MSAVSRKVLEECLVTVISDLQMAFAPGETEARLVKTFVEKGNLTQTEKDQVLKALKVATTHITPVGFSRILANIDLATVLYTPVEKQAPINALMRTLIQDLYERQKPSLLMHLAGFPITKADVILEALVDENEFIIHTSDRATFKDLAHNYMSIHDFVEHYITNPLMTLTFDAPEHKWRPNLTSRELSTEVARIQQVLGRSQQEDQSWLTGELLTRWIGSGLSNLSIMRRFTQAPLILEVLQSHIRIPAGMPNEDFRTMIAATPPLKLQAIVQSLAMASPSLCVRLNAHMLANLSEKNLIAYKQYLTDRGVDVEKCGRLSKEKPLRKNVVPTGP